MRKKFPAPLFQAKTLWLLLGCFTLVNGFLAFSSLPFAWKATLVVIGLALPPALVLRQARGTSRPQIPLWNQESFSLIPDWFFPLLMIAAAFLRFIHLTTLSLWPLTDEAKSGYFAMQLATHGLGSARLLYDFSQLPPLYIWMEGLFFRVFGVSLFSLWCFPALLSLLTVAVFYWGARAHFSKGFALILTSLMALSFWPLYSGRFSHQGSLLLLWECLVFWMAGILAKTGREKTNPTRSREASKKDFKTKNKNLEIRKKSRLNLFVSLRGFVASCRKVLYLKRGFYLGLLTGAGFYTFTSWPSVAVVLALWVFVFHRRVVLPFLGGVILVYLPLGIAWLHNSYGGYIQHVWALKTGEGWWPQILRCFWDFSAFFWKSPVPPNLFAYKPFWGGYLNPLLGACFFLGVLVLIRQGSGPWIKFWVLAFTFFYLPGFLTGGVEMFRILPILPLLLAGAALGLSALLGTLRVSWRWPALGLLLLLLVGMDSHHLFKVYRDIWTYSQDNWFASKSLDRLRAYQVLDDLRKKEGPGLVLSELAPDLYDQSLSIATFGFNSEQNPQPGPAQPHWAALLTNVHYQPCLAKDFPEARWVRLSADMGWPDGGLTLGLIPIPCSKPEELIHLIQADRASHDLVPLVYDYRDYKSRQPVVEKLISLYPLFEGDPFLESCFWEKIADNAYGDRNYEAQVAALKLAIEKGCPAAHLYNDLGSLYLRRSHFKDARQAFERALHCGPNYTSAAAGLKMLDEAEKTGQLPKD